MELPEVLNLYCIVEGDGEADGAMRVLLERLSAESDDQFWVNLVKTPLKTGKHGLIKQNDDKELKKSIELAARNLKYFSIPKGILILIDADDDCPAELGPKLLNRARRLRSDIPMCVVIANKNFEGWLLAGIEGLRGKYGFPDELPTFEDPESIRSTKKRLKQLRNPKVYEERVDQPSFTHCFDLQKARERSPSFQRLCRKLHELARQ